MWRLSPSHYWPVPFKRSVIKPWIVAADALAALGRAAHFMRHQRLRTPPDDTDQLNAAYYKAHATLDPDDALSELGIVSHHPPPEPFLDRKTHALWRQEVDLFLLTERDVYPGNGALGSSRHALLPGLQLKGVGRHPLAPPLNYWHSWGGLPARDSLRALLCDSVVIQRTSLGVMRTLAVFLHDHPTVPHLALAARENDGYRLSQISDLFLTAQDRIMLEGHLRTRFPGSDPVERARTISHHYAQAFLRGVVHRSPSRENLMLDGRFIDSESIDFLATTTPAPLWLSLALESTADYPLGTPLSDVIAAARPVGFLDSWYHQLRLCVQLSARAHQILGGPPQDQWVERLDRELSRGGIDLSVWAQLRALHSVQEASLENGRETFSRELAPGALAQLPNFVVAQCDPDLRRGFSVVRFTEKGDDLRTHPLRVLQHLEIALWGGDRTWPTALERWEKLAQAIGALA